jgi:hypothetical protein
MALAGNDLGGDAGRGSTGSRDRSRDTVGEFARSL